MDNTLESYVKEYEKENFLLQEKSTASRFFHGLQMEMDQNIGRGWSEILRIHNGLSVALADYRLKQKRTICYDHKDVPFKFVMLLSGRFDSQLPGQKEKQLAAGDIWCIHGAFEQVELTQFPRDKICGISISLSRDFIEAWLGGSGCKASHGLEKLSHGIPGLSGSGQAFPLVKELRCSSECVHMARKLLYTRRQTFADALHFESLALELLSRMLTLREPPVHFSTKRTNNFKAAVDKAVDILRHEWDNPPSISALARRVGLNECYIKRAFRQQMGMSIGGYIRQQRMEKALELIETGRYSILETALFVGYSNPSYFSAVFKKFYGHLPSYYLPRSPDSVAVSSGV